MAINRSKTIRRALTGRSWPAWCLEGPADRCRACWHCYRCGGPSPRSAGLHSEAGREAMQGHALSVRSGAGVRGTAAAAAAGHFMHPGGGARVHARAEAEKQQHYTRLPARPGQRSGGGTCRRHPPAPMHEPGRQWPGVTRRQLQWQALAQRRQGWVRTEGCNLRMRWPGKERRPEQAQRVARHAPAAGRGHRSARRRGRRVPRAGRCSPLHACTWVGARQARQYVSNARAAGAPATPANE